MKVFNLILSIIFLTVLCFISIFAQETRTEVLKYFAPKYPPAAQAVRATGTVIVAVKINQKGKVISTIAESGHPLLRKVCENIAKEWIFSTDEITEERNIKITFLLRIGDKNKKDKVKFRKPYILEIVAARIRILDTRSFLCQNEKCRFKIARSRRINLYDDIPL